MLAHAWPVAASATGHARALLNTIAASATTNYLASHTSGRPAPQLAQLAAIHGYTTVFWWCAGIFAAGAIICGALLRPGPLTRPEETPPARPPSRQIRRSSR